MKQSVFKTLKDLDTFFMTNLVSHNYSKERQNYFAIVQVHGNEMFFLKEQNEREGQNGKDRQVNHRFLIK